MNKKLLTLLLTCIVVPAQAGILSDDEARAQIQELDTRVSSLDGRAAVLEDKTRKLDEVDKQQTKSTLDLLSQIEALSVELRKLRGQNEELLFGLRDAQKRQKDFYVDLDNRLRTIESQAEKQAAEKAAAEKLAAEKAAAEKLAAPDPLDSAAENRAYETAYAKLKAGNHLDAVKSFQEFISKYPNSVHISNAEFMLANAQFGAKDYKNALLTLKTIQKDHPNSPRAAEVLFNIAGCQFELKQDVEAEKTLKQLLAKFPNSEPAAKAKKLLKSAK